MPKDALRVTHSDTGVQHLVRSHRWLISSAVRNTRGFEWTCEELFLIWTVRLLSKPWLNYALLRLHNVWRWQQNFEKGKKQCYQGITKQLLHAVTGFNGLCTPAVANGTLGFASGAISPPRMYKTPWTPSHGVQQLYTGIPLIVAFS